MKSEYREYNIETGPSLSNVKLQMTRNVLWLDNGDSILGSVTINALLDAMVQTGAITKGDYDRINNRRFKEDTQCGRKTE